MCGIVGYAGSKQAAPILLDGLSRLEYRGYDSAGLCVFSEGELKLAKSKGRLAVLRTKTENGATLPGYLGIGHTRWATHGAPSDENAHPQLSTNGSICIVHNGIIENFLPLKEFLLKQGKTFRSETDTEVIANLLEYYYEQENDLMKAVRLTLGRIEGSYALGILCADRPDSMIAVKKDSPLIFGFGEGENFIASDVPAILPYTRSVVYLNDGDMVVFTKNAAQFYDANGTPVRKAPEHIEWEMSAAQKGGYPHFMLKEIYDQPKALRDTINPRIRNGRVVLDDVKLDEGYLRGLRRIYMVACGSASYVGNHAKYILERTTRIQVEPMLASEFRYSEPVLGDDTLVIIISQSGETADTLAALREANARGARTLAIVNVSAAPFPRRRTTSSTPVPAPRSPLPRRRPIPHSWPSSICWPCISAKSSARLRRSAMPPCSRACSACRTRWRRSLCRRIWQRSRRLRRPSATTTTCFSSAAISTARPASRAA